MIKVFATNRDGKIEFTKDELENLLNEVWQDGQWDGHNSASSYPLTSPTVTKPYYVDKSVEITCGAGK